jgi:hypothetical protein
LDSLIRTISHDAISSPASKARPRSDSNLDFTAFERPLALLRKEVTQTLYAGVSVGFLIQVRTRES